MSKEEVRVIIPTIIQTIGQFNLQQGLSDALNGTKILIVIKGTSFDPYFNLASEEYMLKNTDDDVFMLWQNERSVIIGKNQNAWAEVNCAFVKENNICTL